jgi:cyanophycin synthetase
VKAAEERGIPWLRLNEQSLIQLGHGKYQQRIQATVTGRTRTSRWNWPATRKRPTRSWPTLGLPVPRQELVQSADPARCARRDAWATRW